MIGLPAAVGHGVESAETRARAGKPASAVIHLRAERQGERVVIEVEDDGQGIDLDRVRQIALERGVGGADGRPCDLPTWACPPAHDAAPRAYDAKRWRS